MERGHAFHIGQEIWTPSRGRRQSLKQVLVIYFFFQWWGQLGPDRCRARAGAWAQVQNSIQAVSLIFTGRRKQERFHHWAQLPCAEQWKNPVGQVLSLFPQSISQVSALCALHLFGSCDLGLDRCQHLLTSHPIYSHTDCRDDPVSLLPKTLQGQNPQQATARGPLVTSPFIPCTFKCLLPFSGPLRIYFWSPRDTLSNFFSPGFLFILQNSAKTLFPPLGSLPGLPVKCS